MKTKISNPPLDPEVERLMVPVLAAVERSRDYFNLMVCSTCFDAKSRDFEARLKSNLTGHGRMNWEDDHGQAVEEEEESHEQ